MTNASFDEIVARLDPPLVVVTAASETDRAGCVVGFHSQCSIDPQRYAVWLSKANLTYRVALFSSHLAVHVLAPADRDLAELFGGTTGDDTDKFARCEWTPGPGGVPILTRCASRVVLERTSQWDDGGDHVCFVGQPVDATAAGAPTPLRVSGATSIEAGHGADDREAPEALEAHGRVGNERPLDEGARRQFENAAAGAGHAVDLEQLGSGPDPSPDA